MKIAVWHNLPSGGGKRALYDHVRGLIARGHTVESWCPPTADQDYLPLSEIIPEHIVPAQLNQAPSSYSPGNLIGLRTYGLNRLHEIDEFARQAAVEINRGNFDLLFANSSMEVAVSSIGRYVQLPKILYLQEPFRFLYEAEPHLPWMAPDGRAWTLAHLGATLRNHWRLRGWRIQLREEWLNARAFDLVLVNSLFSRESVRRAYDVSARVCYLGVDDRKFTRRNVPREDFVIGVGSITSRKNIEFVIEALARIPEPRPRLVWVGNATADDYLAKLEQLAQARGVEFAPQVLVDDETLVDLLNRARLMVYAPKLEPFGFAPLEANACGLPVVAVAEGGVRETVIDGVNGLIVEPEPQAMADAISSLWQNQDEAGRLGEQGHRLITERWSVTAAVDRLEHHMLRLLAKRQPADP